MERDEAVILLDTQSNQVFREVLERHPSAVKTLEVIRTWDCSCGQESCDRETFQLVLRQAVHGDDYEAVQKFCDEAAATCTGHEDIRNLMVKYHDERCDCAKQQEQEVPEGFTVIEGPEALELLRRLFGGGTVN